MTRPIVHEAIYFAAFGVHDMGVPVKNDKRIKVCRTTRGPLSLGVSAGASDIELNIPVTDIRYRILQHKVPYLATTLVHELLHGERFAYYPEDYDLLEHIASEGIAYCGNDQFSQRYMGERDCLVASTEENMTAVDASELTSKLADDTYYHYVEATEGSSHTFNRWMCLGGIGNVLGIYHVNRHLKAGLALSDLMMKPAREIIFG